jgi:hypothetical protein
MQIVSVPDFLRPAINVTYPPHNHVLFEEYFHRYLVDSSPDTDRLYVPIYWTGLYVNRNYGKGDISDAQRLLDGLDRSGKYFTVVQYDDNILNDLSGLDILIFAMGGHGRWKDKCYPIPLNCQSPAGLTKYDRKDLFASFVGSMTHPIRSRMVAQLAGDPKYVIKTNSPGYGEFRTLMSRSRFSLCPRGYGQTSFRICESLQSGSVPVYIYDEPLFPFGDIVPFEEYGVAIHESKIDQLDLILSSISDTKYATLLKRGAEVYTQFYDYPGTARSIISKINSKIDN